jgi:hypothetical protein
MSQPDALRFHLARIDADEVIAVAYRQHRIAQGRISNGTGYLEM